MVPRGIPGYAIRPGGWDVLFLWCFWAIEPLTGGGGIWIFSHQNFVNVATGKLFGYWFRVPGSFWLVSFSCIVLEMFQAFAIALSVFDDRVYEALRIYYWSSQETLQEIMEYFLETPTYTQWFQIFSWNSGIDNCLVCAMQCQTFFSEKTDFDTLRPTGAREPSTVSIIRFYQMYISAVCIFSSSTCQELTKWRLFGDFPCPPYSSVTW